MPVWIRLVEMFGRLGIAIAEALGRKTPLPRLPEPLPPSHRAEVRDLAAERLKRLQGK